MRETGPVRKELSGEEAAPYIGLARTMLGVVKNQLSFNGLAQGTGTKTMPDGTVIRVQSIFGQDKITITKPAVETVAQAEPVFEAPIPTEEFVPVEQPWEWEATATGLAACGAFSTLDPATGTSLTTLPFRWTPQRGRVLLPLPPGYTGGDAYGISGDGGVVVGRVHAYAISSVSMLWDSQGYHLLPGGGYGAVGVSANGSEVALSDTGGIYRWSSGAVRQVATGINGGFRPKMSRDGNYICGAVGTSPTHTGRVWDRAGRVYVSPAVGYYALDVSDAGIVILHKQTAVQALWNINTGAVTPLPPCLFDAPGISSDGLNVVGRGWPESNAAAHYRAGTAAALEPGAQPFVHSGALCVDAVGSHIVIGGYAAVEGQLDNHASSTNDAVWECKNGAYTLIRIPPHPLSSLGDFGYLNDITIIREPTVTAEGVNNMGVAKLIGFE